jgi:hypothetical protein
VLDPPGVSTGLGVTVDNEEPLWVSFQTSNEWVKGTDGRWVSLGYFLNLAPYVNGTVSATAPPRYVELRIEFRTQELIGQDAYAYLAHNGPVNAPTSWGTTRGLAEVTPAAGGGR